MLCKSKTVHGDGTGCEMHASAQESSQGWDGYMGCYGVKGKHMGVA